MAARGGFKGKNSARRASGSFLFSFIQAHQLCLRNVVAFHGALQCGFGHVRAEGQRSIKRVEFEKIPVRA